VSARLGSIGDRIGLVSSAWPEAPLVGAAFKGEASRRFVALRTGLAAMRASDGEFAASTVRGAESADAPPVCEIRFSRCCPDRAANMRDLRP